MNRGKPQPRGLARRQAMLDAATELFLEKGFERTSLSDIVDRSKGSRSTLYEQFGNKEGLLRAMVEEAVGKLRQAIGWDADVQSPIEDVLTQAGTRFLRAALNTKTIAVYRILVTEGPRLPEISQLFFEICPKVIQQKLADWIRKCQTSQFLCQRNPEEMARIFIGSLLGDFHIQQALGLEMVPSDADIEAHVKTAVHIFLNGALRIQDDEGMNSLPPAPDSA